MPRTSNAALHLTNLKGFTLTPGVLIFLNLAWSGFLAGFRAKIATARIFHQEIPIIIRMHRRSRLFYRPGLISLLLFPLLCMAWLYGRDMFREYRLLPVFRMTDPQDLPAGDVIAFRPPERHFIGFAFGANDVENARTIDSARQVLQTLAQRCDTFQGVCFHFEKAARFKAFVQALDICQNTNTLSFVDQNNDVRAYYAAPEQTSAAITVPFACGTGANWRQEVKAQEEAWKTRERERFLLAFWPSGILAAALFWLAFTKKQTPANR